MKHQMLHHFQVGFACVTCFLVITLFIACGGGGSGGSGGSFTPTPTPCPSPTSSSGHVSNQDYVFSLNSGDQTMYNSFKGTATPDKIIIGGDGPGSSPLQPSPTTHSADYKQFNVAGSATSTPTGVLDDGYAEVYVQMPKGSLPGNRTLMILIIDASTDASGLGLCPAASLNPPKSIKYQFCDYEAKQMDNSSVCDGTLISTSIKGGKGSFDYEAVPTKLNDDSITAHAIKLSLPSGDPYTIEYLGVTTKQVVLEVEQVITFKVNILNFDYFIIAEDTKIVDFEKGQCIDVGQPIDVTVQFSHPLPHVSEVKNPSSSVTPCPSPTP
jgi:hypothetical protein